MTRTKKLITGFIVILIIALCAVIISVYVYRSRQLAKFDDLKSIPQAEKQKKYSPDNLYSSNKYYKWVKGELCYREVFTFDHLGRVAEKKRIKPDGSIIRRYTFSYNEKSNVLEWNI